MAMRDPNTLNKISESDLRFAWWADEIEILQRTRKWYNIKYLFLFQKCIFSDSLTLFANQGQKLDYREKFKIEPN